MRSSRGFYTQPTVTLLYRCFIETGVRQLIRQTPLEKQELLLKGNKITLPTPHEMLLEIIWTLQLFQNI